MFTAKKYSCKHKEQTCLGICGIKGNLDAVYTCNECGVVIITG